jgi:hypothetical protein
MPEAATPTFPECIGTFFPQKNKLAESLFFVWMMRQQIVFQTAHASIYMHA